MEQLEKDLTIYPNPTSDNLNIDFTGSNSDIQEVSVVNALGEQVIKMKPEGQESTFQIDLRSLHIGVYVAVVKSAHGNISKKFTIIK
jgi:hypothetical protein